MSPKFYGTTGKILRVDLSKEKIWEETLDEAVLRKFLGGTAMGVKYLSEEVDPRWRSFRRVSVPEVFVPTPQPDRLAIGDEDHRNDRNDD